MFDGYLVSYAQNREDIILDGFFKNENQGFYVDIGAYDPDIDSVTRYFYNKGWRGINIEPQQERLDLFLSKRPDDLNICAGISNKNTKLKLRSYNNQGLSTFSEDMKTAYSSSDYDQTSSYIDIEVPVYTLKRLFKENQISTIQFLKIDVEGLEFEVLESNDWTTYRPEVICIESNHITHDWRPLLKNEGYRRVFNDGLNDYYVDSLAKNVRSLDYVNSVIMKEPIINAKIIPLFNKQDELIKKYKEQLEHYSQTLFNTEIDLEKTRLYAAVLHDELQQVSSLKKHIKRSVRFRLNKVDSKVLSIISTNRTFKPSISEIKTKQPDEMIIALKTTDSNNFANFNKKYKDNLKLMIYKSIRKFTIKALRLLLSPVMDLIGL